MNLEIIKHNDILFRDLLRGIAVKNVAWPYPVESQLKWIVDNMQPNDLHVFLKDGTTDRAYMTLSPVSAAVDGVATSFMGVGCVCSAKKGEGLGMQLMTRVNSWLKDNNKKGLLFCKQELLQFYSKYGWSVVEPTSVIFDTPHDGVFTMAYNCDSINKLEYKDRLF